VIRLVATALRDPRRAARWIVRRLPTARVHDARPAAVLLRTAQVPDELAPGLSVVLTVRHDQGSFVPHRVAALRAAAATLGTDLQLLPVAYQGAGLPAAESLPQVGGALDWAAPDVHADWASAHAAGVARIGRARCLVVDASIEIAAPVIAELVGRHGLGVTVPVVRGTDDVVISAGAVRPSRVLAPARLLEGHPWEDAELLGDTEVFGADQPVFVSDSRHLGDVPATSDEALSVVEVTRRAAARAGAPVVSVVVGRVYRVGGVPPRSYDDGAAALVASWSSLGTGPDPVVGAGFQVEGTTADAVPARTGVRSARQLVTGGRADPRFSVVEGFPRLRWSLKIAAHPGARGDDWGDVFFAEDLAAALRRLGQRVVVDRRQAHSRPLSDHLDDVSVVLRGLDLTAPSPARHNVLWVISHPELVTPQELASFDLRFSAGVSWAREMTERTGAPVRPLLQATDPSRFRPGLAGPEHRSEVLFVGKTRLVFRPIVRDALEAGADLTLYGEGWTQFVDEQQVAGEFVPNDQLPRYYSGARIVLNDHWEDMRRFGLYSNRLFDAVSAGARVVSDEVEGLSDVFGPSVQTYRDVAELRRLTTDPGAWASDDVIAANARAVGAANSFDARARTLLEAVMWRGTA